MSASHPILQYYKTIADITSQMLEKAYANQWADVIALSDAYQEAVEALRNLEPLDNNATDARREYLIRILDNDASIRKLAMPEMERLASLLGDIKRQRGAVQAYKTSQS